MGDERPSQGELAQWAEIVGADEEQVRAAWENLRRRGLVGIEGGAVQVSALAMRRAVTDVERRLASHLSGYVLTEDSYIVRRGGDPPGYPHILNTRIAVHYIANYFRDGWGVADIEADLPVLRAPWIEAAIRYYLNHRAEIEDHIRLDREIYEAHLSKPEAVPA